ncbi:Large exoprotein involved in heme utilization or adhesion (FhaB) (PDB:4RM6), partial [Commensalibacter communis]|uniref:Hint domain-containing protein n=1 Tax=Commensalibacter communis TaxID=2972786 RepID=UPI0022FFB57D
VSSGGIANSTTLFVGGLQWVIGGVASNTTVSNGGVQNVSLGGIANSTTLFDGGKQYALSGGVLSNTIVNNGGSQSVYPGGVAISATVNNGGFLYNYGAVASNTTVNNGGVFRVYNNVGKSFDTVVSAGGIEEVGAYNYLNNDYTSGSSYNTKIYGSQIVRSGSVASGATVYNGGKQEVGASGVASNTTVNSGGLVTNSGTVSGATINAGGTLSGTSGAILLGNIDNKGTLSGNTLSSGGYIATYNGGKSYDVTINSGAHEDIAFNNITNEYSLGSSYNAKIYGSQYVYSGGVTNGATVFSGGSQTVSSGGVTSNTTLSSGGRQIVNFSGIANSTTVNYVGLQEVSAGGVASNTTVNNGGRQTVSSGGIANSTTLFVGGLQWVIGGVASNTTVSNGGVQNVSLGGIANSTTLFDGGKQYALSGGVLSNTIVNNGGSQSVYPGGVAISATVNNGGFLYNYGAVASNTTVNNGGVFRVYNNVGKSFDTVVSAGGIEEVGAYNYLSSDYTSGSSYNTKIYGSQIVRSGSVASGAIVYSGGRQYVSSGGVAISATVFDGGRQTVSSGGVASNTTVSSGGYQLVNGSATNTTINTGSQGVNSGAIATSTTIINSGYQQVKGTASNTTINAGYQALLSGGIATSTTISGGYQLVMSGSIASNTTINSGFQQVNAGGIATSTTINADYQLVISGGIASDTIVNNGGLQEVQNGGKLGGTTTLNMGGSATIYPDAGGRIDLVGDTNGGLTISGLANGGTVTTVVTVIDGFNGAGAGNSDAIHLAGIKQSDVTKVEYPTPDQVKFTLKNGHTITLNITGARDAGYTLGTGSDGSLTYEVCFLTGSMIRTFEGEIAVEDIRIGDEVLTFDWQQNKEISRSVRWVGHKTVRVKAHLNEDEAGYPVRVLKDAVADGVPYKDLLITPEHCLFFDGKFIPVRMLVNGASIYYDRSITDYTYYHIETEEHSVIWADGMLTESYLDTGNRRQFKQHGNYAVFNPAAEAKSWDQDASAILTVQRQDVEPIYHTLVQRSAAMEVTMVPETKELTNDPDLCLVTPTGLVLQPLLNRDGRYSFNLPEDVNAVHLVSRVSRPSDVIGSFVDDRRYLGVLVGEIYVLTAHSVDMITEHLEQQDLQGWDVIEQTPCRWTNGNALLMMPQNYPNKRILVVHALAAGPYIIDQSEKDNAIEQVA